MIIVRVVRGVRVKGKKGDGWKVKKGREAEEMSLEKRGCLGSMESCEQNAFSYGADNGK